MYESPKLKSGAPLTLKDKVGAKLKKNWYVLYTAPRAEKVAQRELSFQGYEVFLPTIKSLRTWKNRQKKWIDEVLFPSYIFVNTEERNLHRICQIDKVMTFLHCGGKPSKVDCNCIHVIKQMLNMDSEITVVPNFNEGETVQIVMGPLAGYEGLLVKQKSKTRFGIQLKEINQTVFIEICTNMIKKK